MVTYHFVNHKEKRLDIRFKSHNFKASGRPIQLFILAFCLSLESLEEFKIHRNLKVIKGWQKQKLNY